jgi:hypothetical protein
MAMFICKLHSYKSPLSKNEKEKLKKEYLRRLRLVLGTKLSAKFKQLDHWQYQYLDRVLELLTGTKKKGKN